LVNLFKSKNRLTNRSELLIFITPRVISDRGVSR
jgi:type II secretory pathway component HofQ